MNVVVVALAAETPQLERLVLDALEGEREIALCRGEPGCQPDALILAGRSPQFFLSRRDLAPNRVICVGAGPADCHPIPLPAKRDDRALERFRRGLLVHIKSVYMGGRVASGRQSARRLVGIGASTGGPQTLRTIYRTFHKAPAPFWWCSTSPTASPPGFANTLPPCAPCRSNRWKTAIGRRTV